MDGDSLAAMLGRWMRLETRERVPQKYLRLADPRVLALLRAVLGTQTLQAGMGRLKSWSYLDAQGALQRLENPEAHLKIDDARLPRLDKVRWAQMSLGESIHGAMARAFGQRNAEAEGMPMQSEADYEAAIAAAQRFSAYLDPGTVPPGALVGKIRDQDDMATAVALSLLNAVWESHPDVRQLLDEFKAEETLTARCMDIHARLMQPAEAT
jgi:hypothetical protein